MEKAKLAISEAEIDKQKQEIDRIYLKIKRRYTNLSKDVMIESLAYQLHNLYCAYEDLFKIVTDTFENNIEEGVTWHKELLRRMSISIKGIRANVSTAGTNCLYGYYNQNTNKIYLRNDANTAWLGGFVPGSANVIENIYSKIDCSQTIVSGSDTNLTVNWNVTFKSTFIGSKKTYCYVRDDVNAYKSWTQVGTWNIQSDVTPPTGTIKINNDSQYTNSSQTTLNFTA